MMDSQRQNAYLKLIRDLLECPSGQEVAILMAKPDLVDATYFLRSNSGLSGRQ
jgi:hypothetical protein